MPSEDTQFTPKTVPARKGLPPNTRPIAEKPIAVRFFTEDVEPLNALPDRSGFIRQAVHEALQHLQE